MKQITYNFENRGVYSPDQDAKFGGDSHLKLIVNPHDFSLSVSGETLRSSSCGAYSIIVSRNGETCFYDAGDKLIAKADGTDREFAEVKLKWSQDKLELSFGCWCTVDYYPNCDGEHDRWGTEWDTQRTVTLHLTDHSVETK